MRKKDPGRDGKKSSAYYLTMVNLGLERETPDSVRCFLGGCHELLLRRSASTFVQANHAAPDTGFAKARVFHVRGCLKSPVRSRLKVRGPGVRRSCLEAGNAKHSR